MKKPPFRIWIALMVFMITFTNYMLRSSMSVSIQAMSVSKSDAMPLCVMLGKAKFSPPSGGGSKEKKYEWTTDQQGLVMSGYFYGFLATSLFAGMITDYFGPYWTIIATYIVTIIVNSTIPFVAVYGWEVTMVFRVMIGMLGGLAYPSANVLIARWAPPTEKGKFMAAMMGNTMGTVVALPMVGAVSSSIGWTWGFHVQSFVLVAFLAVYGVLVSDSPTTNRFISDEEKEYIVTSQAGKINLKKSIPPYMKIMQSVPFWAMTIGQFGNLWVLNVILTYIPTYLKVVQGFNLKSAAFISALPYLMRMILSVIFGIAGDYMRKKEMYSLMNIRRIFAFISLIAAALPLYFIYLAQCDYVPVIAIIVINQAINGGVVAGHLQNPQDLAPNYAGSLYGLMSFFGGVTGVFVPMISSAFQKDFMANQDVYGPGHIYALAGTVMIVCAVVFIFFGSAEVQPWNEKEDTPPKQEAAAT